LHRSLKIAAATLQAFVAILSYNLNRFFPNSRWSHPDASFVKDLVGKLNFPLETMWTVIFLGIDRLSRYVPRLPNSLFNIALLAVGLLIVLSVAAFWWFVLSEVEVRLQGRSFMRRSRPSTQAPISFALAVLGVWAIVEACRAPMAPFNSGNENYYLLVRGLILFIWAAILLIVAIFDFAASFRGS